MKQLFTERLKLIRLSFLILALFAFSQCAEKLSMKDGSQIDQLGVCLYFAPGVPEDFQKQFEGSLDQYQTNFNSNPHLFKLTDCQNENSLQIRIEEVTYTNKDQRAAGIALSTLGLVGLPATLIASGAPIIAWFYYIPQNSTVATTAFTADIAHPSLGSLSKTFNTGGIFGNDDKQRERHAKKFNTHLNMLFTEVERSYSKTHKRRPKFTANNQAAL